MPERTYPPLWRVAAAFILAPAVAAFVFASVNSGYDGLPTTVERIWRSTLIYAAIGAYPPAVLFGIPAYLVLRQRFSLRLINCAIVGGLLAALPWAFLVLAGIPDQASIGCSRGNGRSPLVLAGIPDQASIDDRATVIDGSYTAYGWLMNGQLMGLIALFGALGGAMFWVIAVARSGAR